MTRDAKIGLLLGLLFIFLIAFVINGLPSFSEERNNNELTTNMVGLRNTPPGIAAKERELIKPKLPVVKDTSKDTASSAENEDIRFEMPLPKSQTVSNEVKSIVPASSSPAAEETKSLSKQQNKSTLPKIYVVNEGDSLALIAKKFYGAGEGNKEINITRIFEANRKVLRSPDEIYIGQKLIIPPLTTSTPGKGKVASAFSSTQFIKVESIGERHLFTENSQTKQCRSYTTREGDSLWKIAAEKLGDGSRYSEIAKINADILEDEDNLSVGMRLKIPVR
ncbi:MAG: LysM peptidoglycan-binding domain-containing protein [Planctomycetota bacterium]|nr:MAG: LysM peptidoglycan-binding domain-containing protein [Planctomycetota bacterium]